MFLVLNFKLLKLQSSTPCHVCDTWRTTATVILNSPSWGTIPPPPLLLVVSTVDTMCCWGGKKGRLLKRFFKASAAVTFTSTLHILCVAEHVVSCKATSISSTVFFFFFHRLSAIVEHFANLYFPFLPCPSAFNINFFLKNISPENPNQFSRGQENPHHFPSNL